MSLSKVILLVLSLLVLSSFAFAGTVDSVAIEPSVANSSSTLIGYANYTDANTSIIFNSSVWYRNGVKQAFTSPNYNELGFFNGTFWVIPNNMFLNYDAAVIYRDIFFDSYHSYLIPQACIQYEVISLKFDDLFLMECFRPDGSLITEAVAGVNAFDNVSINFINGNDTYNSTKVLPSYISGGDEWIHEFTFFNGTDWATPVNSSAVNVAEDPLPLYVQGINDTKNTVFSAFGLIAVILLVSAAMLIVFAVQGGSDPSTIIISAITFIGLAIVLFVGFIVISQVASSLI